MTDAYDRRSGEYVQALGSLDRMPAADRATITGWRDRVHGPIVDVGCGPGHWSHLLAKGADARVVGVDGSAAMVTSARARFPGVGFGRVDIARLPLADDAVGAVLAWYSVIHAEPASLPGVLGELARVMRPGGSLLLGFFDGPAGTAFDHAVTTAYFWSVDSLSALLAEHGLVVDAAAARQDAGARRHGQLEATLRPVR